MHPDLSPGSEVCVGVTGRLFKKLVPAHRIGKVEICAGSEKSSYGLGLD